MKHYHDREVARAAGELQSTLNRMQEKIDRVSPGSEYRQLLNFRSEAGMTEAIAKYMRARGLTNQAEALRQIVARGLEAAQ